MRIAWEHGATGYRLRNSQKRLTQEWRKSAETFLKFYAECNRRFGKSSWGLGWLDEDARKSPGGVSAFFAPVKEGLKDYILPIIEQTFEDCPDDLRPVLDSTLTLNYPNGSKIIFRGSNNQTHRTKRGNAFRRVYIDEARDVDDLDNLLESVVIPSLFSTQGRVVIGSTPADNEDHPLHAIKQAAEKEGWYFHSTILDCHRYDPTDFPAARIAQWEKETTDAVAWQREYLAMWVKDPTKTVIPEWKAEYAKRVPRDECFHLYHKYSAMDLGVKDKTAAIFGYYDFRKACLVIEAEFSLQDAEVLTDRIAKEIKDTEQALEYQVLHDRKDDKYKLLAVNEKVYRRIADNNNPLLVNDLNSLYGLDFFGTQKDELPAMINMCREWVKAGRVLVDPSCKELIGCLSNALWDKHKKDLARSKTFGHFDALMALVYLIRNVDTHTNPIPEHFGKTWASHAIPVVEKHPNNQAYALQRIFNVRTDRDKARADFSRGKV